MSISNRPASMRNVDHYKSLIDSIFRDQMEPGANQVMVAGTKIAAYTYMVWEESERPGVAKDFWREVGMKRGKTNEARLVNYLIDSVPPHLRRLIQEIQNQITSTLSYLIERWKPTQSHTPTFEEVLAKIEEIGIHEYHRLWMTHLSRKAAEERQRLIDNEQAAKREAREKEAARRGVTVSELGDIELEEAKAAKLKEDAERWHDYLSTGEVISKDWRDDGLIYIRDGNRLIRVAEHHTQRIHDCMVR